MIGDLFDDLLTLVKPLSSGQAIVVAIIIAAAAVFAAYQYLCHSMSRSARAFVDIGVGAIEQASNSLAELEHLLHYDKAKKEFTLRLKSSSAERVTIKDTDLASFVQQLVPKPAKVAVIYDEADFASKASRDEFEQQTRRSIESAGPEVWFMRRTPHPGGGLFPNSEQEN